MLFIAPILKYNQDTDAIGKFERYKTPPHKYNLEEQINRNFLEIRSFEKLIFEKSICTKENCSCHEIKTAFETYSFKQSYLLSPNSLETQMDNKTHNKMNVINIINNINQQTNKNKIENSSETKINKNNIVKNLINDLNDDEELLKTNILGLKRNFSTFLFEQNNYNEIPKEHDVLNTNTNKKEKNNYYIKEIKFKKYNQSRIKYNRNYYLMKSMEKLRYAHELNDTNYCVNKKMRKIEFKKRARKTGEQIKQLTEIYKICTEWNKKKINEVAAEIGLSVNQVYKWIWDQKRKCDNECLNLK